MASMWSRQVLPLKDLCPQMHSLQGIIILCHFSVFVKHDDALLSYLSTFGLLK